MYCFTTQQKKNLSTWLSTDWQISHLHSFMKSNVILVVVLFLINYEKLLLNVKSIQYENKVL